MRRFKDVCTWMLIFVLALPEQFLFVKTNGGEPPAKSIAKSLQENLGENNVSQSELEAIAKIIADEVDEFKKGMPSLLASNDPLVRAQAWELAQVASDLLPADLGPIERTAAMNSFALKGMTPEEWNAKNKEILASAAKEYDEIVVYTMKEGVQEPALVQGLQPMSLSYVPEKKSNVNLDTELAIAAFMLTNPSTMMSGGLFDRLRGGSRGNSACNSCEPRSYQQSCGTCYQDQYQQAVNQCGQSYARGNSRQPGYRSGNTWVNTGYRGGGQTTLGATCCNKPCYGIGLKGARNSRFTDVKGIGLRQSFQRYEGPPFGQGRLVNFFVNPTCVQRARRRLMIVIGLSVATAGGGGVPFLILQNENPWDTKAGYCMANPAINKFNDFDRFRKLALS